MEHLAQNRPPSYELFFTPLQVVLNPGECEKIQFAYFASKYGHARQVRDSGERYFDHPKAAAWIYIDELGGTDPRQIITILLHDLPEDQYLLSPYRIALNFGEEIALDVRSLTKLPKGKETTEEYLARVIAQGKRSITAKLCDRLHNLRTLRTCTVEKQRVQIEETEIYHLRLLVPELRKEKSPWNEYANQLEEKIINAIELTCRSW